jgi:uncharacterized integral membrane protein
MKTAKITVALIILVVLFIFSVNNSQIVEIVFLGYRSPGMPLFLIIIFMFLLGGALAGLLAAIRFSQLHRKNQFLQSQIDSFSRKVDHQPGSKTEEQPG